MSDDCEISKSTARRERLVAVLVVMSVWLWIFWPVLFAGKAVGFRDAVYMHYPVLKWTTDEMMAGRLPLWSPYDGPGMPVVGEGSTAIFYPIKAILFLPRCSFVFRYNLFLSLHVLLASFTGYWCAKRFGCSRIAATFAGLSYGFSGPVLFQVTNQIYLVSAAWLPVAMGCVRDLARESLAKRDQVRRVVTCSIAMAMMVLGGDPQMAVMVVIVIAGTILAICFLKRFERWRSRVSRPDLRLPRVRSMVISLVSVCVVSFLLAAAQILPSAEFARYSERATWNQPLNIFGLTSASLWPVDTGIPVTAMSLVNDPVLGTHHDHIYQFSQPPWSVSELLVPGISGSPWPSNTRWLDGLPGADRMWNVSLYQGGLAFFLAIAVVLLRKTRLDWWLIGIGLFFCIASFGWYGTGWALRECSSALGFPDAFHWLGRPTGGVYWFLVTFVPVVSGFRYPAKMFVVATLCISLLAARNLDRLKLPKTATVLGRCLLASVVLGVVALAIGLPGWMEGISQNPGLPESVFGILDLSASHKQIWTSLIYVISAGLISVATVVALRRRLAGHLPLALLFLLMLDLSICQTRIVPTINSRVFDIQTEAGLAAEKRESDFPGYRALSLDSERLPEDQAGSASIHRLEQIAKWQIQNDTPRFNLLSRIVRLDFFGSLQPAPKHLPRLPVVDVSSSNPAERNVVRFWDMLHQDWEELQSGPIKSHEALIPRVFAIALNSGSKAMEHEYEFILPSAANQIEESIHSGESYLHVTSESADRIEADFVFNQPVTLVFPEGWCGGWAISMTGESNEPQPLVLSRENRDVQAKISANSGKIRLIYRPLTCLSGILISFSAWMAVVGMKVFCMPGRKVVDRMIFFKSS